jgi:protein involved in polysaccharide export with SLBB domain
MQKVLAVLVVLFAAALSAKAQATLRVGDPIEMKLSGVPNDEQIQFNNTYTVDATGAVNLPYINKVKADGLTPAQLASAIEGAYRANKVYTNPTITIMMAATSRFVNVGGAVRNATRVPFTEDMTLLAAINAAGGFNDFADQRKVRVLRGNSVKLYDVREARRDPKTSNCSPAIGLKFRRASSSRSLARHRILLRADNGAMAPGIAKPGIKRQGHGDKNQGSTAVLPSTQPP